MVVQQSEKPETMDNPRTVTLTDDQKRLNNVNSIACEICHKTPKGTTSLSCEHVFCKGCIEIQYKKLNLKYLVLCPVCGESTDVTAAGIFSSGREKKVTTNPQSMETENSTTPSGKVSDLVMMEDLGRKNDNTCDFCAVNRLAVARCIDCLEILCTVCRHTHVTSQAYKHHRIKLLKDMNKNYEEERTTEICSNSENGSDENCNQSDNETGDTSEEFSEQCTDHKIELTHFCRPCQILVCKQCRLGEHKGHRTKPLRTLIVDRKEQLHDKMEKVKDGMYKLLQERLESVTKQITEIQHETKITENEICERAEQLKQQIENIKVSLIQDLELKQENALTRLQNTQKELHEKLKNINDCLERSNNILNFGTNLELATDSKQLIDNLQTMSDNNHLLNTEKIEIDFELGQLPVDVLRNGFGHCSIRNSGSVWSRTVSFCVGEPRHVNLRLLSKFDCPTPLRNDEDVEFSFDSIHALTSVSSGKVALCCDSDSDVVLTTDQDGCVIRKFDVELKIDDLTKFNDNSIFLSSYHQKSIKKINDDGKVMDVITTQFYPRGLTCTNDGGLVVCMVDDYSTSVMKSSRRFLMKIYFDDNGKAIDIKEFGDNKTRLFTRPFRVAESSNGDICVIDKTSMGSGRVVVLGKTGIFKFVYNGPSSLVGEKPFSPSGLCCDKQGRILIADNINNTVHIVDNSGQFIGYLLTKDDEIQCPTCLALDSDNHLWIGNDYGEVRVYLYDSC